jgi:hypothetical protein
VLGCRIYLYSSRIRCKARVSRETAPVATWSRTASFIGQARRDCVFFLLAVPLWWQEVWPGRGVETGISNKAVFPFSRRICVSVRRHSAGRPQENRSVEPAGWWRDGDGRSSGSFFNKWQVLHKIPGVTSRGFTTADAVSPVLHMAERRPSSFNLLASEPSRRPFSGSVAAFIVELSPSGFVPGDYSGGRGVASSSVEKDLIVVSIFYVGFFL